MPLKFVRNDITLMQVDAIVNTANPEPIIGVGTDTAVYKAAGDELLAARKSIGKMEEGEVAATPGFGLKVSYIIHAVSPKYIDGKSEEEKKLRSCYQNALKTAQKLGVKSIAFPLIATGNYGYPRKEAFLIALDELTRFLLYNEMMIYLVLFDEESFELASKIYPGLEDYISQYEVDVKMNAEYNRNGKIKMPISLTEEEWKEMEKLLADLGRPSFSEYLKKHIERKGLKSSRVYLDAYVSKQTFSKIMLDPSYHPKKLTALCLAVGAQMTFPEAVRLLSLAGYSFSEYDKIDIVFSYFLRHHRANICEIRDALERNEIRILSEPE